MAAILVFVIDFQPRSRVRVLESTASWTLAVVALTFGISSVFKREPLWPLALVALFISIRELAHVLEMVR